ncbi:MAG: efflux RND transporter periplasmic adaptor subunit [Acidobacteria bacterium]|nr:efflux RND transporter periplasmic adaptor subunit [Acidobacteriota bacterium]
MGSGSTFANRRDTDGGRAGGPCGGRGTTADATAAAPQSFTVGVAAVEGVDEPVTIEATGSFEADESSDVAPDASGRVIATPVDVGQFVKEGAPLVRIQGITANLRLDEARAASQRAEANVRLAESQDALAQTTAQRYAALLATGDVSKTVADQARTQAETSVQSVATARASLAEARAQLSQAEKAVADVVVLAPFSGYISARNVSLGEYVQPSTAVVRLLKIDPMRLQLTVPAVQAGQVTIGQRVIARVDAYPDRTFEGQITAINPAISPESRAFRVEARVPNREADLKPGMFAVATVDQGRTERAMIVPRRAVVEDVNTNSFRIFVIDDQDRARLRVVQLAARQQGDVVRIVTGITEGERVATSNLAELYDGAPVTIGDR